MKRRLLTVVTALLIMLFGALAATERPAALHPSIDVEAALPNPGEPAKPHRLNIRYILDAVTTKQRCETLNGSVSSAILEKCPFCAVKALKCKTELEPIERQALSSAPIDSPSARTRKGVIVFQSKNAESAQITCLQTAEQSKTTPHPISCFAANTERPANARPPLSLMQTLPSLIALLAALSAAWLVGWLIIRYEHLHAHFSHDHTDSGPQKFHATPTPRIGGLALAAGLIAAGSIMIVSNELQYEREFGLLLLAGAPAFLGGLVEDITKRVGVSERLMLTMLSGAVAAWLLGAIIPRIDIAITDQWLMIPAIAVAFTIFAVGGVANAINIIDGYNGLAGGIAVMVLAALAGVAAQVGDALIFSAALALIGAVLGFLRWNWPRGKVFMGDGGAYLLGFLLAELSVLLVLRNPQVSPWFPVLLMIYPIFETFYSMYRRRIGAGRSPGQPDNLHLHQLIYQWITRPNECRLTHNNRVAKFLWLPLLPVVFLGAVFATSTPVMLSAAIALCVVYVYAYRVITHRHR